MKTMQTKVLPADWLSQIESFEISSLSVNGKILFTKLVPFILIEKEKSLTNSLLRALIERIFFSNGFDIPHYAAIPKELFKEVFEELGSQRGYQLDIKLHSLFVELLTYKYLVEEGFKLEGFNRSIGSCDLVMKKDDEIANFEVKFKESHDIRMSRLYSYLYGKSFLSENEFLRGKKLEILLKIEAPNYDNLRNIFLEIDEFINRKEEVYNGRYIELFANEQMRIPRRDIGSLDRRFSSMVITNELTDSEGIRSLIRDLFCSQNGHITKMIEKAPDFENFKGCLSWAIPFHKDVNVEKIKRAFEELSLDLDLDFDLYVCLSGIGQGTETFLIPAR
ncbi:MAG: hypothetical protein ISEC1_P0999 [Thiomicrorhabdus sp.]|nr:MAG: hypothetical protein ISEC1_P0999 [Thiomicrorhabdus sp.]